jgi:hypothetical protein
MTSKLLIAASALTIAFSSFGAAGAFAKERIGQKSSAYAQKELKRIKRPHFKLGKPISPEVRRAAGAKAVFDHRTGGVSRCSYITYRGERAIVCD